VRSAARALLAQPTRIPADRRATLEECVLKHYPEYTEVTQQLLEKASQLQIL
jgi:hypothetical protein